MPNTDSQHPSLFGALPMGYAPPYNGYGYQVCFYFSGNIPESAVTKTFWNLSGSFLTP
jgi:hypothetical protein